MKRKLREGGTPSLTLFRSKKKEEIPGGETSAGLEKMPQTPTRKKETTTFLRERGGVPRGERGRGGGHDSRREESATTG